MRLRNRVMLPPHASAIGNIYGTDEDAERNIAYFEEPRPRRRASPGSRACPPTLRNTVIPGFDPTGVGAATTGFFRLPFFVERVQAFSDALHGHGATVSVQMVHQGGMPHGASAVMSAPAINLMPHVMDQDDIDAFVREYAASARLSLEGRGGRRRGAPQPRRHARVVPLPVHEPAHRPLRRLAGEPRPLRASRPCRRSATWSARR